MTRKIANKVLKNVAQRAYSGETITATLEEVEALFEGAKALEPEETTIEESEEEKTERLEKTLKPCPFCGGKAHIMRMGYPHYIYCDHCGAKIHGREMGPNAEEASVNAWNSRWSPATAAEIPIEIKAEMNRVIKVTREIAESILTAMKKSEEFGDYIRKITEQEIERQRQREEKKQ